MYKRREEKLPVKHSPYSIQVGYEIADVYLRVAAETGDENAKAKGMEILTNEIMRYGSYLPYFMELRRTLPASGFSGLTPADRYVPTYLYLMLQRYTQEGGDAEQMAKQLQEKGIDLAALEYFIK